MLLRTFSQYVFNLFCYLKIDYNNVEFHGESFKSGPGFWFCREVAEEVENYKSSGDSQASKTLLSQIPRKSQCLNFIPAEIEYVQKILLPAILQNTVCSYLSMYTRFFLWQLSDPCLKLASNLHKCPHDF